jgi:hypothetical protein
MPGYPAYLAVIQAFPGTHLILELSRYADFRGLIPSWKPDSFQIADDSAEAATRKHP